MGEPPLPRSGRHLSRRHRPLFPRQTEHPAIPAHRSHHHAHPLPPRRPYRLRLKTGRKRPFMTATAVITAHRRLREEQRMPMDMKDVQASFVRCCLHPNFPDTFSNAFMATSPEVARLFKNTDFTRQIKMLQMSLNLLISHAMGIGIVDGYLHQLAEKHSRHHLNVEPHLYTAWRYSRMKAVKQHDPKYTPALEQAWRTGLGHGIELIKSRYKTLPRPAISSCDLPESIRSQIRAPARANAPPLPRSSPCGARSPLPDHDRLCRPQNSATRDGRNS